MEPAAILMPKYIQVATTATHPAFPIEVLFFAMATKNVQRVPELPRVLLL
jgi:hypothetical protein